MIEYKPLQGLTRREIEILHHLAIGWSNKQIAENLRITTRTVKFHTHNLYEKLEVNSRSEAIVKLWMHRMTLDDVKKDLYQGTG